MLVNIEHVGTASVASAPSWVRLLTSSARPGSIREDYTASTDQLVSWSMGSDGKAAVCWSVAEWDSALLGVTCAKVNSCGVVLSNVGCERPLLVAALGELKTQAQSGLADNVFFRAPAADQAAVRAAEDAGFRTIGIHLEFSMDSTRGPEAEQSSAIGVRHAVPEDASALADIADQFQDDRFHRDGRFDRGRVANLWKTSVQNALAGRAEAVLVAETDRRVAGFLVLTRDAPVEDGVARPAGRVFLIAVSPAKRRRGVGTLLLQEARCYSERQGFTGLRVGTQITNGAAIAQYEAAGFRLREGFYELSWWADVGAGGVGAT